MNLLEWLVVLVVLTKNDEEETLFDQNWQDDEAIFQVTIIRSFMLYYCPETINIYCGELWLHFGKDGWTMTIE